MNMRTFQVSVYCGEHNATQLKQSVNATTAAQAAITFCEDNGIGYPYLPLRKESPRSENDCILSVWSVGAPGLGQRVWIVEV
jgi:hypothetical protein